MIFDIIDLILDVIGIVMIWGIGIILHDGIIKQGKDVSKIYDILIRSVVRDVEDGEFDSDEEDIII